MVMISLSIISGIIVELSYQEIIRYKLAIYQRDEAKAQSLAEGGENIAYLFLIIQKKMQLYLKNLSDKNIPLSNSMIWDFLPLKSNFLKKIVNKKLVRSINLDVKQIKKTKFEKPSGGFGHFRGFFNVEIIDEDSKISLLNFAKFNNQKRRIIIRDMLLALFDKEEYNMIFENNHSTKHTLNRLELVGSIFSYIDVFDHIIDVQVKDHQWGNKGYGSKKDLYLKYNIKPKCSNLDSFEELRLVYGITDSHIDILRNTVSVYGISEKINIFSANAKILETLIRYCVIDSLDYRLKDPEFINDIIVKWNEYKKYAIGPVTSNGFVEFLQTRKLLINNIKCKAVIGTSSQIFTIKTNAKVGQVNKTLTLVTNIKKKLEEFYYFNNN